MEQLHKRFTDEQVKLLLERYCEGVLDRTTVEVDRYNNHQAHFIIGETPSIRFEKAKKAGNSLFRPFALPKPYTLAPGQGCLLPARETHGERLSKDFPFLTTK